MEIQKDSLKRLNDLLTKEITARNIAEKQLAQKESELEIALQKIALLEHRSHQIGQGIKKWDERLFEDVVNNLPGIVFQVQKDAEGIFVINFVSPVLHQALGVQVVDARQLIPYIHPDDREKWVDSLETTYNAVKAWKQEIRFLMPDGVLFWWFCSATPSYSPSGELLYNGILLNITRQKNAELALKESEKRWQFAMEGSGDGLWEYDVATKRALYSPVSREMLGIDEDGYDNDIDVWWKSIHPEDLSKVMQSLANYNDLSNFNIIQYRALNKKGKYEWIMDRGVVFTRDKEGKPTRYIGVHTNINKMKKVEFELAATATKLRTLVTTIQDGIMLEDKNNTVILSNQAFVNIFEIPILPQNLIGANIEEALKNNKHQFVDNDAFIARRHYLLQHQKPASNEEIILANGKFLSRDYNPLIIDGECVGHMWKYTDITQRKKAKDALIEAEKRYRELIDNMDIGLVEYSRSEDLLYANPTFFRMSGYTKEELSGNIVEQLLVGDRKVAAQDKMPRQSGAGDGYEIEILNKAGEKKWWYVSIGFRRDDKLNTNAIIGACLDVTMQKRLEHELRKAKQAAEQADNDKDIFLANMSHEIRTPLNAIFALSHLMEKTNLVPQQRFYMETIINSTTSLMVVVNDILDHSKISAGKLFLERSGFRLADLMGETMDMLAYGAQKKGVSLVLNNSRCCGSVLMGDSFRVKQILVNILTNALKFTSKGSVLVNCGNKGMRNDTRHINIEVIDTGKGMTEEFLQILFEKFTQEREGIDKTQNGTGLGLSISKHLMDLMEGTITVKSTKGVGTTFNLDFYFEEGDISDLLVEQDVPMDVSLLKNKRILIVEDNDTNQFVVETMLGQNGMRVWVAGNGQEAVDMVKNNDFDLVLMDMQMPVMDGLMATSIIRATNKDIPIIALTANALKTEQDKCFAVGMNGFLAKPFEETALLEVLCKWMAIPLSVIVKEAMPNTTVQSNPHPLYSLERLSAQSPRNSDFIKILVKMFVDDASITVLRMKTAIMEKDLATLRMLAHRIKPSIEQMDMPYVPQMKRIEELCETEDTHGELAALVHDFEIMTAEVISDLNKIYGF